MSDMSVDIFSGADRLFIVQEFGLTELVGLEAPNHYRISKASDDDKEGTVEWYIHEESEVWERWCCGANRRLKLFVHEGNSEKGPVVQTMEKPFSLQGCCCMRGSFDVKVDTEQAGFVEDPCRCCWLDVKAMDAQRSTMFTVAGSPCQWGMCCPCCASVGFKVDKEGRQVGSVEKVRMDCNDALFGMNRFVVDMTDIEDPVERRMLFASAMLLDLNYFEKKQSAAHNREGVSLIAS